MDQPHAIRLKGPWELEPLAREVPSPAGEARRGVCASAGATVEVPGDWGSVLGEDFRGTARYTRRFNCPTNLGPQEHVELVFEGVDYEAQVTLNGHDLGS